MKTLAALLVFAWLATGCGAAAADGVPLWSVRGEAGTVHILGSVHLLREADYPLPEEVAAT